MTPVRDSQRLVCNGVPDRTPDVNDTNTPLQEAFRIVSEVAVNSLDTGLVGLVNVYALNRATRLRIPAIGVL